MVYYSVMLFGYVASWFNKRIFFYSLAAILIVMAVFRYGVGIDYFAYEYLYNALFPSVIDEIKYGLYDQEVGFRVIGAIFKNFGLTYQHYVGFFAVINLIYMVKLCKRYSINPTLSLLIFFCFYYVTWVFSAIRQGVVIAVGLYYLLKYIEEKKPFRLILVSLLLSLIHTSALILILFYFVSRINLKKKTLIVLSVISIIFSFLPTGILVNRLSWLPVIGDAFLYVDTSLSLNFLDSQGIVRIILLIMALVFYDYYSKQGEMSRKIINLYIISIMMYFFFQFSELIAARLAIYGKFLDIIILANVLYGYKEKINRLIYVYAIFVICSFYLYKETDVQINGALVDDYKLAPYVSVFNEEDYNFSSHFNTLND